MSKLRIGIRNMKTKSYPLSLFSISDNEVEKITTLYNKLDFWNSKKSKELPEAQIEKRANYFHIWYLPIFSTSTDWTLRRQSGEIYSLNKNLKEKVISKVGKKKFAHWYLNIIPIVLISQTLVITSVKHFSKAGQYVNYYYEEFKKENALKENFQDFEEGISENYISHKELLEKSDSNYVIEFQFINALGYGEGIQLPYSLYAKANSTIDNEIELEFLPETVEKLNLSVEELKELFKTEKTEIKTASKDSITMLLPKNIKEVQSLRQKNIRNVIVRIQSLN